MQLALVAVGALRPACRELCDDYVRRLGHYARVTEREVKEAKRLRAAIPAGTLVVATTRDGQPWSSRDLAARLERWQLAARPVAVVVGDSYGLDPAFLTRGDHRWSVGDRGNFQRLLELRTIRIGALGQVRRPELLCRRDRHRLLGGFRLLHPCS